MIQPKNLINTSYDYIIIGGGLSGLSLACALVGSPLRTHRILIVESDPKPCDQRTFSFWTQEPKYFDGLSSGTYRRLALHTGSFHQTIALNSYRYVTLRGVDFYNQARAKLAAFPNVHILQDRVTRVTDGQSGAVVSVDGNDISGKWIFDSRMRLSELATDPARYTYLKLVFRGWEVDARQPLFDTGTATLMDFRTPQSNDVRFFYVLPFDERRALVEYTLFTSQPIEVAGTRNALNTYLTRVWKLDPLDGCQVTPRESGNLLVTDQAFPRRQSRHVLAIGLHGGRLKPSTGYAFTRIQRDSQAIVKSLHQTGHPFDLPADSALNRELDALMLAVMDRYPQRIPSLFGALFSNNPIDRVLRFLDEDASPNEVGQIMASLPPGLFLKILAGRSASLKNLTHLSRSVG